ncbi:hypothetical protein OGATHE_005029 [Ogataea polymorpha]|uniref:Uncharacterized protein n=1 Tax=Ogataea polymorpha TaxID=460523 RepID=A0A9P8NWF2_9ASCO|nr:hypothetical protein OGATHE_005029 [Ogataea polymorpha]
MVERIEVQYASTKLSPKQATSPVDWSRNVAIQQCLDGDIDEVDAQHLRNEWERSRGTDVTLDDFEVWLSGGWVLGLDNLHVEWPSDVPCSSNLVGNLFESVHGLLVETMWRQHQGSVTGMDSGVLDVL